MRTLEFNVKGQSLEKDNNCDFSGIVSGTVGYLKAKFNIDEQWFGCSLIAEFRKGPISQKSILNENRVCIIPSNILGGSGFKVVLTGYRHGYSIKTNAVTVNQTKA